MINLKVTLSAIIKFLYLFLLFWFMPQENRGENIIKYISNINGLSNNSVNCIYQDNDDILWFGTWDGVNTYDGREIKSYRYNVNNPNSISNNVVRQIVEQNPRYIWIATDYGINRWDKMTQQFQRFYLGTEEKVPKQERSYLIGISSDSTIFSFVKEQGLFYFDDKTEQFIHINCNLTDYVSDICIDSDNGVLYFLFQNGQIGFSNLKQPYKSDIVITPIKIDRPIQKIFFSKGHIILISEQGISLMNSKQRIEKNIKPEKNKVVSSALYHKNKLYISFVDGGCEKYNLENNSVTAIKEIPDNISIFTIYQGKQDILWIGSDGQGVLQLYDYKYPFNSAFTNFPVRCFCEFNEETIMVGTKGEGIKLFDKKNKTFTAHITTDDNLISNSVYTITKNKDGDIFIGTEGEGINIYYSKVRRLKRLNMPANAPYFKAVYNLHFTNNDSLLWVGTAGHGLLKMYIVKQNEEYHITKVDQYISSDNIKSLKNDIVYAITSDKDKTLWFGTRGGGLYKVDIQSNKVNRVDNSNSNVLLTNNDILCLFNENNHLWIGTSYGLNLLDKQNNDLLTQFTNDNGLSNNTIHGILKDTQNNIWVSTNQGISRISIDGTIKNFSLKDGLQNDEFSDGAYFRSKDHTLYFGGVKGFNFFTPQNIELRKFEAPVALSGLKIYNNAQNIYERIKKNTLKLSYDERYISFSFIVKDFINNENCEYAYRLLNYSDEWILLGNNPNIIFSKLSPGKYILEVKGTNGDKIWSNEIYRLNIVVGYPWWLSIPAIVIYLLLISILIYIVQAVVKNRIRLNRQILIEQNEMQHQQKLHESKLNFFTNAAHEFFTPLTLIYGPAQLLLEKKDLDAYTKKYLLIMKNNAERMQKLICELMEFRKAKTGHLALHPENIDIKLLTNYISDNYADILIENKIDYKIDIHDASTLYTDRDALEKIFLNLLSNAFKYTPRNGQIYVSVWQDTDNILYLSIRNSGKGLTESQMSEIFDKYKIFDTPKIKNVVSTGVGLNLTKGLTELLGGKINVSSEIGSYVEFNVEIPPLHPDNVNIVRSKDPEIEINTTSKHEIYPDETPDISILIVEDEKNIRELLKDILEPAYNISEAEDGKQALALIKQNHPDIIITDILMPNMDGISLIDKIKSNFKTNYIPIIGISAKSSIEDQIDAYKHGADMYITKPFHPKQVISTIENLIAKQNRLKEYFNSKVSVIKIKDGNEIHREDCQFINEIIEFVQKNIEDDSLNSNSIADFFNISKATLYRKLKDIADKTPSEFIRSIRLEHASKLLKTTQMTVSEIMYKSGFSNKSYFYREFAKQYKVTPKDYRNS